MSDLLLGALIALGAFLLGLGLGIGGLLLLLNFVAKNMARRMASARPAARPDTRVVNGKTVPAKALAPVLPAPIKPSED